jgi:hypothetical protein
LDRVDAYRHFAAQCVELAHNAQSPRDRTLLIEIALLWSRLAEFAFKIEMPKEATAPATILSGVHADGVWRVQITWANGSKHRIGKFGTKQEAEKWIEDHRWLTERPVEPPQPKEKEV